MPEGRWRLLLGWGIALLWAFPVYWVLVTAISPASRLIETGIAKFLPRDLTLDHFRYVLANTAWNGYLWNSVSIAALTVAATLVFSSTAAYVLARRPSRMTRAISGSILGAYFLPKALLVIPIFTWLAGLGLANSSLGLIIAQLSFTLPFGIWLMKGFYESLPIELEEAAYIDGASQSRAFWSVVLPLTVPGIVSVGVFAFLLSWNDYLFGLVFLTKSSEQTLPVGIVASLSSEVMLHDMWAALMAASVMASIPVVLLFAVAQRLLASGMASGAVKG